MNTWDEGGSQGAQRRLASLLDRDPDVEDLTVVGVPSITLRPEELEKIPGAVHFEQRLLYLVQVLRARRARLVYVSSQAIEPAVVDYVIGILPSLDASEAYRRLTLLDCADSSPVPLADKILQRPALVAGIRQAIADPADAYLVTYTSTTVEQELASRLGIPLFACDPRLSQLGLKSGARKLMRCAGVPIPDGFEDLRSETDVVDALVALRSAHPALCGAVVKLNDSFAGAGNALFSYRGAPSAGLRTWVRANLLSRLRIPPTETWTSFREKLGASGGVVEVYVDAAGTRSPSVQLELRPDGVVRTISTHDQILAGPTGQTFVGCTFPANGMYRRQIGELAQRTGRELAAIGVVGPVSIDFIVDADNPDTASFALECNLRMGGANAPFMFMHGLVQGRYDHATGSYLTRDGEERCYRAADRLHLPRLSGLSPQQAIDAVTKAGLRFDHQRCTGVLLYALGTVREFSKLGVLAIGSTPQEAEQLFDRTVSVLTAI
ncbi:hypothetical protein EDC02_5824 [Micromonospora sp. Llam0]|uniref:peptide ligase PGM1-related protein n=1 Tax=Micromonospora sp. Llam0 TaxID=2485143 RepID=UPI000F49E86B|nr:peptide ligase PGM1-related protein [Micromonospora sp. Llam0]ROO50962.1 hypothetical protein EDC02_5824 [Micromonospora sp. Llam0]